MSDNVYDPFIVLNLCETPISWQFLAFLWRFKEVFWSFDLSGHFDLYVKRTALVQPVGKKNFGLT